MDRSELAAWVQDARARTFALVDDLTDEQLIGPRLRIVNPLLWEIGHLAWFQEKWVLRHALGRPPLLAAADSLYDSAAIPHDTRWDLPLPSREQTAAYMREVRDRVLEAIEGHGDDPQVVYFVKLTVFHEDMHDEAFTYTRQTLQYPAPSLWPASAAGMNSGPLPGDVTVPGGTYILGAAPEEPFVFDNEKWAHPAEVKPFVLARAAVTQSEFLTFVEDHGYHRRDVWTEAGWRWKEDATAEHPVYWRFSRGEGWMRRDFDRWVLLEPHQPVVHINWHEAQAYCRWARRRLPTEAEWELAASDGTLGGCKRRFPWGDTQPTTAHANLDARLGRCADVGAFPGGDGTFGCRQLIGNVWEWTDSDFLPYPGFVPDPYKEYSVPWFGTHKVLRGGCWVTRGRLLRSTWRNFYTPDRRDVWAGFRTCAPSVE